MGKAHFEKLTPVKDIELKIYNDALDFVFENNDIRNVAVSGAYSAGKSSVIESYKDKHKELAFLHISLANFELSQVIFSMGKLNKNNRINNLVFNLPEVKMWKGVLNVTTEKTQMEIMNYSVAVEEILHYAITMYDRLYSVLVEKMQGEYQNLFVEKVLNQLLSEDAFEVVANIVKHPRVKPGRDYYVFRDTAALAFPVSLCNSNDIGEYPFSNEKSARGNRYQDGVIPSYSYSCINFRNIFRAIVNRLISEYRIVPLFSTFLDIVLKDSAITSYTGYTFEDCRQDAFKFNIFLAARDNCTMLLSKNNLVENETDWKSFSYAPSQKRYEGNEAIAVLMYKHLIDLLNLSALYQKYQKTILHDESITFVEEHKKDEILEQMKRK
jgi:hypothetical protein